MLRQATVTLVSNQRANLFKPLASITSFQPICLSKPLSTYYRHHNNSSSSRKVSTLTSQKVTEILSRNEVDLEKNVLPSHIRSLECNQLASNSPIEDRLRVSTLKLPGSKEPTLLLGVFDGHGGGTTVDLISRRLFDYIALSLHPEPSKAQISNQGELRTIVQDLHNAPNLHHDDSHLRAAALKGLLDYQDYLTSANIDIVSRLKSSFQQCDDDLAKEIQENLTNPNISKTLLHHYLSATVSGCCAVVVVFHDGIAYVVSSGDCRAVLGLHNNQTIDLSEQLSATNRLNEEPNTVVSTSSFKAYDLNEEHNCDNINEIRRLAAQHPKSEQNTMIKHNRLLGHLMPFRAFGDYTYKWPIDLIEKCGITRVFGAGVIPSHYETPPYLIVEPDINVIKLLEKDMNLGVEIGENYQKYLIMASDGLWELFESSRDVIETIVDHAHNSLDEAKQEDYDRNSATYLLRSALRFGPHQDIGLDLDKLRKLYHIRLESTLTLPKSVVRNFRDDISIIVVRLN